jgi:hypothetical protein
MKWGVRRDRSTSKPKGSSDYENARALRKKGSKNLSTNELQELTKRLNLEKQYRDLNPSDFDKGMNLIKKITAAGTTLASLYAVLKTPLAQDILKKFRQKTSSGTI